MSTLKLSLAKETLRALNTPETVAVQGGDESVTCSNLSGAMVCVTFTCALSCVRACGGGSKGTTTGSGNLTDVTCVAMNLAGGGAHHPKGRH